MLLFSLGLFTQELPSPHPKWQACYAIGDYHLQITTHTNLLGHILSAFQEQIVRLGVQGLISNEANLIHYHANVTSVRGLTGNRIQALLNWNFLKS